MSAVSEASDPMFSAEFEEQLGYGKYTCWVLWRDLSEQHLLCLLSMIGEFDASAPELLRLLWKNRSSLSGAERSVLALAALHCIVRGERFDRYEWARRMASDGRMRREVGDLPEPVRAALSALLPGAAWDSVMVIADGYELGGKNAAGECVYAYFSPDGGVIQVGPERRWGESANPSIFPATLVQAAARSSRTRWAVDRAISEDHLVCLLWLIGVFESGAESVLPILDEHSNELPGGDRAIIALNAMYRMAKNNVYTSERFDVDEFDRRIGRGRAHLELGDLPEPVRTRLDAASPKTRWQFILMTPEGYELGGEEAAGRYIEPSVSRLGEVVFKHHVSWDVVPSAVASTIMARFPKLRMPWPYARLAADGTIVAYEIVHVPQTGKSRRAQRIAVGLDGTEIPAFHQ